MKKEGLVEATKSECTKGVLRYCKTSILERAALTPIEFASLFGREKTFAYRLLYAGKIQCIKPGGRILIPTSEVNRLLGEATEHN